MSASKTLFEVFVPQCFNQVSFRRTDRSLVMTATDRATGKTRTSHFKRHGAQYAPQGVIEDFRAAMEMTSSKPL